MRTGARIARRRHEGRPDPRAVGDWELDAFVIDPRLLTAERELLQLS